MLGKCAYIFIFLKYVALVQIVYSRDYLFLGVTDLCKTGVNLGTYTLLSICLLS